ARLLLPRISRSGSESSILVRATLSAGIVRNCSPAASSVVSQSASAVESQASSVRPERFLKPRTATDRRGIAELMEGETCGRKYRKAVITQPATMRGATIVNARICQIGRTSEARRRGTFDTRCGPDSSTDNCGGSASFEDAESASCTGAMNL